MTPPPADTNVLPGTTLPAKRPSRWGLFLPIVILALICVGWSVFWVVASHFTDKTLQGWMAHEASLGRMWNCPDRDVGGFPFNIAVTCHAPSFQGRLGDAPTEGHVATVRALAQVYQPRVVLIELDGPLTVTTADGGPSLEATWSHLRASLHGAPDGLTRLSLAVDTPQVTLTAAGQTLVGRATHLETHVRRDPQRPASDNAYDYAFDLRDALIPALDGLFRSDAALSASGTGLLNNADFNAGGTPQQRLELWRTAGGSLDITTFSARKGPASVDATGSLSIDALHRPQGHLDTKVSGLGPVLARFGIPVGVMAIDNLLGGLLGTKPKQKDPASGKDQISLPVTFDNGRLRIGPIVLSGVVPPLY